MIKINKIKIENFRLIKSLLIDLVNNEDKKLKVLTGKNESGKSSILTILRFFQEGGIKFKDTDFKDVDKPILLTIYTDNFDYSKYKLTNTTQNLNVEVQEGLETDKIEYRAKSEAFVKDTDVEICISISRENTYIITINDIEQKEEILDDFQKSYYWESSEKYLINQSIDLNIFKNNIDSNIPLRNIFYISKYNSHDKINSIIDETKNPAKHFKLTNLLSENSTKHINKIWHDYKGIKLDFVKDSNFLTLLIDEEQSMEQRSSGFKHFFSFLFSISIDSNLNNLQDKIILIDEPETSLHISSKKSFRKELEEISKKNTVIYSTHDEYMLPDDKSQILKIKKNNGDCTILVCEISDTNNSILNDVFDEPTAEYHSELYNKIEKLRLKNNLFNTLTDYDKLRKIKNHKKREDAEKTIITLTNDYKIRYRDDNQIFEICTLTKYIRDFIHHSPDDDKDNNKYSNEELVKSINIMKKLLEKKW